MGGMGRLKGYIGRYWRRYLVGASCLFGTATLVMWIPWWIREGIRIIERGGALKDLTFYAILIIAAGVAQGVIRTFSRFVIFNVGRDIEYDLRNDLFAHLLKLPVSFYHSQKTGDLMSRVINDISAVRMLLGPGILNVISAPLYYLYATVLMFSIDPRMTLMALLPFPFLLWVVRSFRGKIYHGALKVQQQMSALSSHVQENLSGIHVVKAYSQERSQIRQFVELNQDYQEKSMEMAKLRGRVGPFMRAFSGLTTLIVLWYGGVRVIGGDLMIADIVAFIAYLNVLSWPTAALGHVLSSLERGRAAMGRLEEVFRVQPAIADPPRPLSLEGREGTIELRNVCFLYDHERNGKAVLEDISFSLEPGKTLAIVGRTGSGKTSLVQLLPRLYDAASGEIRLGGRGIRMLSLSELRRSLGYVPQDPFLFSTSLRENLAFGRDGISKEEIEKAVRLAKLDRDVEIFPQGLDTLVGERGVTLSGGQKQRATLARALLLDPPILILDDCLSSVDTQTEGEVLKGLKSILKKKSCIIISNRVTAVKDADEILVLDEGAVIERGNHQSLLSKNGLYADLFRQQQLSEELAGI